MTQDNKAAEQVAGQFSDRKCWSFASSAFAADILGRGWSTPSEIGLWNDGTSAVIRLNEFSGATEPVVLSLRGGTFLQSQRVVVSAGSDIVGQCVFSTDDRLHVVLPPSSLQTAETLLFEFPDADIPAVIGFNEDRRTLAFRMSELELRKVNVSSVKVRKRLGTFVLRRAAGLLRLCGTGLAPAGIFRLNGQNIFAHPIVDEFGWSAWLHVPPHVADAACLSLDVFGAGSKPNVIEAVEQWPEAGEGAVNLYIHMREVAEDVRYLAASVPSFGERLDFRLNELLKRVKRAEPTPLWPPAIAPEIQLDAKRSSIIEDHNSGHAGADQSSTPQAFYIAASRLLLIRLKVTPSTEEIVLANVDGQELGRFIAGDDDLVEYGLVIDEGLLSNVIFLTWIDRKDAAERSYSIRRDEIKLVNAEIAALAIDSRTIRGVFWTKPEADQKWQIKRDATTLCTVTDSASVMLEGLSCLAVPFTAPMPHDDIHSSDEFYVVPAREDSITGRQRPLKLQRTVLKGIRRPPANLMELHDRHKGKRAWIVGNGPSVQHNDLNRIPEDDVTFCFNRFHLCYDEVTFREDYIVSADSLMIADFGQEMIDYSHGLAIFCAQPIELQALTGRYVALTPGDASLPVFSLNSAHFVSRGGSSVFVALQLAYYMGVRDIVLYGIDYSFSLQLKRNPQYAFPVAYDDNNHFIPSYRAAKPWCPPNWADIASGFLNARAVFECNSGSIVNATRGGRLETFERVDFEQICCK